MKLQFKREKKSTCGTLVIKALVVIIIVVGYSGCGTDPPPPPPRPDNPWLPCDCGEEMCFTLSFGVTDISRFTVDPDRSDSEWKYKKGELVTITYAPLSTTRFQYWEVDPPSHLAHLSQDNTIYVYMTANTTVRPKTESNIVIITIENDFPSWATVSPALGSHVYNYGDEVTISATPNKGYKVFSWGAKRTGHAASWGRQNTNPIKVKAREDYTYSPDIGLATTPEPTLYSASVSLTGEGTADIFCASIPATGYAGVAPFCYAGAKCASHFDARCLPHRGYDLTYWRWTHDNGATWNYKVNPYYSLPEPSYTLGYPAAKPVAGWNANFEANLTRTVSLDIVIEGQGVVTSPDFRDYWNPQLYTWVYPSGETFGYAPPPLVYSNEVEMTAEPCPGYGFSHWDFEYNDNWYGPINGDTQTIWMNHWHGDSLLAVEPGKTVKKVKAVFESCQHIGEPNNGSLRWDSQLPSGIPPQGIGYYQYPSLDVPGTDIYGCLCYIHKKISNVGVKWNSYKTGQPPRIGIGDISKQGGGYWIGHGSHQNGLDVDVRYVRNDGVEDRFVFGEHPDSVYDKEATKKLLEYFISEGANLILVDVDSDLMQGEVVKAWPDHADHFHVRFPKPAEQN